MSLRRLREEIPSPCFNCGILKRDQRSAGRHPNLENAGIPRGRRRDRAFPPLGAKQKCQAKKRKSIHLLTAGTFKREKCHGPGDGKSSRVKKKNWQPQQGPRPLSKSSRTGDSFQNDKLSVGVSIAVTGVNHGVRHGGQRPLRIDRHT